MKTDMLGEQKMFRCGKLSTGGGQFYTGRWLSHPRLFLLFFALTTTEIKDLHKTIETVVEHQPVRCFWRLPRPVQLATCE